MKNQTRKKTNGASSPLKLRDLRAQIEMRAYELWLVEGCCHGNDLNHWLKAERELADATSR